MRFKSDILPEGAIIEMVRQGAYVKVSAIDPVSKLEVSIVGDPSVGPDILKSHAIRKLDRMLRARLEDQDKQRRRPQDIPSGWDL
ncbi:DUF6898 family protein [Aestuariispira insulae]|uniref:DUF6898 domain-containing protein n=1 Tax=Aestuariispira insulae TaxID=1461337 RepID=A0A3D9HV39_9PROT|nr:hypothetical protein [Aestuariispira insulae]RED53384.1 hypothetical protein DFP90_101172 [Aestuariispira insulae]